MDDNHNQVQGIMEGGRNGCSLLFWFHFVCGHYVEVGTER